MKVFSVKLHLLQNHNLVTWKNVCLQKKNDLKATGQRQYKKAF